MKNPILKVSVLSLALCLGVTACSTNTNEQNTFLGAGTGAVIGGLAGTLAKGAGAGWVIAAGVVVGALIGGWVGHQMDSTDNQYTYTTMDSYPVDHSRHWRNGHTHMAYRVVPTSRMFTINGNTHCRNYNAYYQSQDGREMMTQGTACRQKDGTWVKMMHQ